MDIRELGPGDDPGALLDLSVRAFGPIARADQPRWQESSGAAIAARRYLGAFDGGRMLAAAQYHDMIQWWHGRPVPMAGVANVMVAPEERGRGAGRTLMRALLGLIGERGYPVSALYPATMALYRSLGWEIAGSLSRLAIPSHALRSLVSPDAALPRDDLPRGAGAAAPPAGPDPRAAPGRSRRRRRGADRHRPGAPGPARLRPEHPRRADRGPLARRRAPLRLPGAGRVPGLPLAAGQRRAPGGAGRGQLGRGHPGPLGRGRLTFLHRPNCPGGGRTRRPGAVADDRPRGAADRPGSPGCSGWWTRQRPSPRGVSRPGSG